MAWPRVDYSGQTIGPLTISSESRIVHRDKSQRREVLCTCKCGSTFWVSTSNLSNYRHYKGCRGCLSRTATRHGHYTKNKKTKTYSTWASHKARGILAAAWHDFPTFLAAIGDLTHRRTVVRARKSEPLGPGNFVVVHYKSTAVQADISRFFRTLGALRKPATVKEIQSLSGLSEKTVRRDLAQLKQLGFDVRFREGEFNRRAFRVVGLWKTLKRLIGD